MSSRDSKPLDFFFTVWSLLRLYVSVIGGLRKWQENILCVLRVTVNARKTYIFLSTLTVLGMLSLSYHVTHLCDVIVLVNVFELKNMFLRIHKHHLPPPRAPDRGGGGGSTRLVSILRKMAACPVSLAQSLCHCVTNGRTRNLVNYTVSNVIFHWIIRICIAFENSWFKDIAPWKCFSKHTHQPQNRCRKKRYPVFIDFCVGKGWCRLSQIIVVSRVASMACRMLILRLWRAAVSN